MRTAAGIAVRGRRAVVDVHHAGNRVPTWRASIRRRSRRMDRADRRDRPAPVAPDDADRVDGFALGADGNLYVAAYAASTRYPQSGALHRWVAQVHLPVDALGTSPPMRDRSTGDPVAPRLAPTPGQRLPRWARRRASPRRGCDGGRCTSGAHDSGAYLVRIDGVTRAPRSRPFLPCGSRSATPNAQTCVRVPGCGYDPYACGRADGSIYVGGQANAGDMPRRPRGQHARRRVPRCLRDARQRDGDGSLFVAASGRRQRSGHQSRRRAGRNVLVAGKCSTRRHLHGPRGGFQTSIARQWSWSNTCEATVPTRPRSCCASRRTQPGGRRSADRRGRRDLADG